MGGKLPALFILVFMLASSLWAQTDISAKLFIKPDKPVRGDFLSYRYEIKNLGSTDIPKKPVLGTFIVKRDGRRVYGQGIKLPKPLAPAGLLEIPWKTVHERQGGKYIGGKYSLILEVSTFKDEENTDNNKDVIEFYVEPEDRSGTDLEAKLFIKPEAPQRGDLLTYRYEITNIGKTVIPKKPVLGSFVAKRDGRRVYGQGIKLAKPMSPGDKLEIPWKTVSERLKGTYIGGDWTLALEVSTFPGEENKENNEQVIEFHIEPEDRSGTDIEANLFIKQENPQQGDLLTYRYEITNVGKTIIPKKRVLGTFVAKKDGRRLYGQGIKMDKPMLQGDKLEIPWKTVSERLGGKFAPGSYELILEVSTFKGETNVDNNKQSIMVQIPND